MTLLCPCRRRGGSAAKVHDVEAAAGGAVLDPADAAPPEAKDLERGDAAAVAAPGAAKPADSAPGAPPEAKALERGDAAAVAAPGAAKPADSAPGAPPEATDLERGDAAAVAAPGAAKPADSAPGAPPEVEKSSKKSPSPDDVIVLDELVPAGKAPVEIKQTQCRAITIAQLVAILDYVKGHCVEQTWNSSNPDTPDILLDPQQINLYDLTFWVIKPATKRDQCSYVELIAEGEQSPNWFVSHWWGEPVAAFISCLQGHSRDRGLPPNTAYWVCAYANNQWQVSAEVADDPAQSSFRRAIDLSIGTVTVLDQGAVTYTRVWCAYEIFVSLTTTRESSKYMYDVYTTRPDGISVGLADGCAMVDFESSRWKNIRESAFPVHLATKALDTQVEKAKASFDSDRCHILNAIVEGPDLNANPPDVHPGYDRINSALRGRFASASLAFALKEGVSRDVAKSYAQAMLQSGMKDMDLDFSLASDPEIALEVVQTALPECLQDLALTWYNPTLGPKVGEVLASAIRKLPNLIALKVDLLAAAVNEGCIEVVDAITGMDKLERLELWFNQNVISSDCLQRLTSKMKALQGLRTFYIDFELSQVDSGAALAFAMACKDLPSVKKLTIGFRGNTIEAEHKVEFEKLKQEFRDRPEPVQASIYLD